MPGTSQPLVTTLISKPEWQVVVRRIQDMYNALLLLLYTAVPYNLLVSVVKLLGAGVFLIWLEPHLQRFLAVFIGGLTSAVFIHVGSAPRWACCCQVTDQPHAELALAMPCPVGTAAKYQNKVLAPAVTQAYHHISSCVWRREVQAGEAEQGRPDGCAVLVRQQRGH